jgi:hypothetical protein
VLELKEFDVKGQKLGGRKVLEQNGHSGFVERRKALDEQKTKVSRLAYNDLTKSVGTKLFSTALLMPITCLCIFTRIEGLIDMPIVFFFFGGGGGVFSFISVPSNGFRW